MLSKPPDHYTMPVLNDNRHWFQSFLCRLLTSVPDEMGFRVQGGYPDGSFHDFVTKAIVIGRPDHSNDPAMSFVFGDDQTVVVRVINLDISRISPHSEGVLYHLPDEESKSMRSIPEVFPIEYDDDTRGPSFIDDMIEEMDETYGRDGEFIDESEIGEEYQALQDKADFLEISEPDDGIDMYGDDVGNFFALTGADIKRCVICEQREDNFWFSKF